MRLCDYLNSIRWNVIASNVDDGIDLLISNRCVTIFTFLVWFSPRLLNLVRLKERSHRTYKRTNAYGDRLLVNNLRTKCKNVSKGCHTRCINNTERLILDYNNAKPFSSFVSILREYLTSVYQVYSAILFYDLCFVLTTHVYGCILIYCFKYIRWLQQRSISSLILMTYVLFTHKHLQVHEFWFHKLLDNFVEIRCNNFLKFYKIYNSASVWYQINNGSWSLLDRW